MADIFDDIPEGPDKADPFSDIPETGEQVSAMGALGRSAGTAALPALGAAAGGAGLWALGAALAPETGGLSLAIPLAGMFIGGAAGGAATEYAQRKALELAAPESAARLKELQQLDVAQQPVASLAGRLAGTAPTFAVAPGQTIRGLAAIPSVLSRTATQAQTQAAASAALQLGLGTAGGVVTPLLHGEAPTLAGIGESALQASLFGSPRARVLVPRSLRALEETPTGEGGMVGSLVGGRLQEPDPFYRFTPRTERVRPTQAEPVIIGGESQAARLAKQEPEIVQEPEIIPANQAVTAPGRTEAGGEISFAAPAEAGAIPSARQAAQEQPISAGKETSSAPPASAQEPEPLPARPIPPEPTPSPQALGFLSPGGRLLNQIVNAIKPKAQATLPSTPSTAGDFLPDLGDRAQNKAIAVEPTGIGRIPVLNWLFDPRHRAKTEPEKSIINYFYEQAVGKSHVQALGATFGTKFKELFPRNEAGEFSSVGRTHEGQSLHPSDVFEQMQRDPNSYRMTPEQRQAFDELMRYEKRARELERQYGMAENPETNEVEPGSPGENAYYTRGKVVGQPPRGTGMGGVSTGARQFFQKRRAFESEQQGVSKGFQYPMNVDDRILLRLSRLYKAIADRRLAEDEGLGGRWGSDSGPVTYHEGQVFQPAFRSGAEYRIFPVEVANKINSTLGAQQTQWIKALQNIGDAARSITLGLDVGWGFIQGLPTAFKEPKAWADAQATAFRAFTNPDAFAAYVRNNAQAVREMAQFGSSVGSLPEMVAGLREGGLLSRIPGGTRFARSFQSFLDVAKIEKWKSRREITPREEWPTAIQEIEHELGAGRMEAIGVSPGAALAERLLLLAPSYYRGGIGLIGDMAAKGVTGAQARRAMGSYMVGITATFMAGAAATGMPWEEIKRRLSPTSGNFLMIPLKVGGKSIEVGFGGIMRSFMRLGGSMLKTSIEHPENWGTLATDKNPITKWLRGHAAPVPRTALDMFSGKDYAGEDTDMASFARGNLPLALQSILKQEKGQTTGQTVADAVFSFSGLLSWPQNTRNALLVERNRLAREKYGAPYENLKIRQQALVTRTLEKNPEFAKGPPTPKQIEQAFRMQVQRQEQVQAGLDDPIRSLLAEKELRVPGFEPNLKVGPAEIVLTDAQQSRYKALIIEEYNKTLKRRLNILRKATPLRGQDLLTDWAGDAKQRAQTRLQLEFNR